MAPLEGKLQMFIAKNRKTSELAGCVFLKKFSMVGSRVCVSVPVTLQCTAKQRSWICVDIRCMIQDVVGCR